MSISASNPKTSDGKHGNSLSSTNPNHVYVIVGQDGNMVKVGIELLESEEAEKYILNIIEEVLIDIMDMIDKTAEKNNIIKDTVKEMVEKDFSIKKKINTLSKIQKEGNIKQKFLVLQRHKKELDNHPNLC